MSRLATIVDRLKHLRDLARVFECEENHVQAVLYELDHFLRSASDFLNPSLDLFCGVQTVTMPEGTNPRQVLVLDQRSEKLAIASLREK